MRLVFPIIDDVNIDYLVKVMSICFLSIKLFWFPIINMYSVGRYFETTNILFSTIFASSGM